MRPRPLFNQMVPIARRRDAVGRMALGLARLIPRLGYRSLLFTERQRSPGLGDFRIGPLRDGLEGEAAWGGSAASPDVALYHHSVGTSVAERFLRWPARRKILVYHNITPPELLTHPRSAEHARWGLEQLPDLLKVADLAIGLSAFSCEALRLGGARRVAQLPYLLWDRSLPPRERSASVSSPVICVVGRIEPHKRVLEVVEAYRALTLRYPSARLVVAGNLRANPEYSTRCLDAARGLAGVAFLGRTSDRKLAALYRSADVLVTLSEHEGFCVPLVEAMRARLPIVAFPGGAIPETLGPGGLLIETREPGAVAEAITRVLTDRALGARVATAQAERSHLYTTERFLEAFSSLLTTL